MALPVTRRGRADSPALVLLHGATTDHRMWEPQLDVLAERYHLLAPDLPGYGGSQGPFSLGSKEKPELFAQTSIDWTAPADRWEHPSGSRISGAVIAFRG